jgi:sugar/nucleoside kinase (ribokinase family)
VTVRDLVAVGEVLLDVSAPGLVAGRVVHERVEVRAGGTPVNAARAAVEIGASAAVVGRVGADVAGAAIRAELGDRGIEPLLAVDPDIATGTFVEAGRGPDRAIATDRGASAGLAADDVPRGLRAQALLVSGYALLQNDTAPAAVAALERIDTRWRGVTGGSSRLLEARGADEVHRRADRANVLVVNEEEAAALTGAAAEAAALELAGRYEVVCVTRGPLEAVAVTGYTTVERARPLEIGADDVSGYGDRFTGALLVSLARGAALGDALRAACAAAAPSATWGPAPTRDP